MDPSEHPAYNIPDATDHHDGTVFNPVTRTGSPVTFRPGIKSFPPGSQTEAAGEKD